MKTCFSRATSIKKQTYCWSTRLSWWHSETHRMHRWLSSPQTQGVLVLVIANYDFMLKNISISCLSRVMGIEPIWRAKAPQRVKALPGFRAFTDADNTRRFSRIGQATWLQVYMQADGEGDVINSLQMLSTEAEVTDTMMATLPSFICATYCPKKHLYQNHLQTAMASLLQAHGRKWQATSYTWGSETTCPYPSQSVGTG